MAEKKAKFDFSKEDKKYLTACFTEVGHVKGADAVVPYAKHGI